MNNINNIFIYNSVVKLFEEHNRPELLKIKYRMLWQKTNPLYGICSVASELLFFALGGKQSLYMPYVCKDGDITHWWLQSKNGNILDPTVKQYTNIGLVPPYYRGILGRPCFFMGVKKSNDINGYKMTKRCQYFWEIYKCKKYDL